MWNGLLENPVPEFPSKLAGTWSYVDILGAKNQNKMKEKVIKKLKSLF